MSKIKSVWLKLRTIHEQQNLLVWSIRFVQDAIAEFIYKKFRQDDFAFSNARYPYCYSRKNQTWLNERAIEVPLIWEKLRQAQTKAVLEIGNVMKRYYPSNHEVIDKYERGEGVLNVDVLDFRTSKKYDLIISISTLEHVGFDETPLNPEKVISALKHIDQLLAPSGEAHLTMPSGYNKYLDGFISAKKLRFSKMYCFKRDSHNKWVESDWDDIKNAEYSKENENSWHANGLVYAIIQKQP